MATVGSANVLIRPTFTNFQKDIEKELGGTGAKAGKTGGQSLGSQLAKWGKRGAAVAGGAIATVTGTALVKGFGRLQAIENAQAKMRGLGYDAEQVRAIMDNALASVKGTAFGLGEAATVAASAVAAGIEPGEALQGHLTRVANNAAAAGVSMDEMGRIFNRAATQANGVQNDVISQLADRGIPIYQALAEQMGVTAGEVFKLASEGKVDFETFSAAAEAAAGDVAAEMGGTLTGSFQNALAALGRVGANLLSGVYPYFAEFFQGVQDFLGPLEERAQEVGEKLGEWLTRGAEAVKTFIEEFKAGEGTGGRFRDIMTQVKDVLVTLWDTGVSVGKWLIEHKEVVAAAGIAYLGLRGAIAAHTAAMAVQKAGGFTAWLLKHIAATKAGQFATKAWAAATWLAQGAQKALNLVMRANPIGLIITAVTALVGALVWFFTKTETGKKIVTAVWTAIKDVAGSVVDWFKNTALPALQAVWDGIVAGFEWVKDALGTAWDWIKTAWQAVGDFFQSAYDTLIQPVIDAFVAAGNWLRDNVLPPLQAIGNGFIAVGQWIFNVWANVIKLAWDLMVFAAKWLWNNALKPVFEAIKAGFAAVGRWISDRVDDIKRVWEGLKAALKAGWDWIDRNVLSLFRAGIAVLKDWISARVDDVKRIWDGLKNALKAGWDWIDRNVFQVFRTGIANLKSFVSDRVDDVKRIWDTLKGAFRATWDWIDRNVFENFRRGIDRVKGWVESGVESIGRLWRGVGNLIREPINWVINTVWNDGLKAAFDNVARAIRSDARLPAAPTIPRFARGGQMRDGWKIVGEEGPELIHTGPGYVYTAQETKRLLGQSGRDPIEAQAARGVPPHGGVGSWLGDRWNDIKRGASVVGGVIRDAAGNVVEWARGGLADLADLILSPIFRAVSGTVGRWGDIGRLGGDAVTNVKDQMVDWIRGKDDEGPPEAPGAGGRQLRGAQSHVNRAAHFYADSLGGFRLMQAFNNSMAGGHPKGLAVDFFAAIPKLNRLADMVSGGAHFDRFRYMAWQNRLWSPDRGWRAQGRGFGNDPQHRRHVHLEWFDQGGWLKPGWNTVYNGLGRDEHLINADHAGGGMPEYLYIKDVDDALIGRMRVEARGEMKAAVGAGRRSARQKTGAR